MSTITCQHIQGFTGQEAAWDPIATIKLGDAVRDVDLAFAQAKNFVTWFDDLSGVYPSAMYDNSGLNPTDTIDSIDVHITHEWLDAVHSLPDSYIAFTDPTFGRTFIGSLGAFLTAVQREDVVNVPLNPATGLAFTYDDFFTPTGFLNNFGSFSFIPDGGGSGTANNYRINQIYIVFNTSSAGVEVDITGSGGVGIGSPLDAQTGTIISPAIGVLAGTPPELHGNQWGLQQFVMRSRLEDRL